MAEFLQLLRSFQQRKLSGEALLDEIDRLLASPGADAVTMLVALDEHQEDCRVPASLHEQIAERLLTALDVLPASALQRAPLEAMAYFKDPDGSATVLVDEDLSLDQDAAPRLELSRLTSTTLRPGRILKHRFRLLACVGEGGMGRVFKAIDLRKVEARADDVYVAVKILTLSFREYIGSLSVLQREAARLQELPHPNIVRVIDCDRDAQTVFMTMEYLPGQPLKQRLASTPRLTRAESMRVLDRIAAALTFAHENDVVHGDLKPGNVILADDGEVKVIDFGIARVIASSAQRGDSPGVHAPPPGASEPVTALTPSYASPEMLEHAAADPRDDVYALACMAYEMLTGVHPFGKAAATTARDSGAQLPRLSLSRIQFNALVNGLHFDRAQRTPTVAQFMQDLHGTQVIGRRRVAALLAAAVVLSIGAFLLLREFRSSGDVPKVVGEVFRDCPTCPFIKVLPAGRLEQGSADSEADAQPSERPRHVVDLMKPLGYGVSEVTRAQFKEYIDATGQKVEGCAAYDGEWKTRPDLSWSNVGFPQTPSHPVTCVSWPDATGYAKWLSDKTGHRYRLPSASEWEYAARGKSGASRPWADKPEEACSVANVADEAAAGRFPGWKVHECNDGYVFTAPVGAFATSESGVSDMLGNVFEWVQDCWHDTYVGAPTNGSAWTEATCTQREMRGGSWFTTPEFVRAAYRNRFEPNERSNTFGFRVVRELEK